ncbi:uncharacterized protein BDZ99DRAFT_558341 [Mytilinidion resinicola]|uniref:Uncharacterized protein n=1 Tax=Mytilinidion resinicola TaxID=574789 RepID=A0A6A6YUF0_9PEZI|nr:uncharacterized protein BDZ99DRAFT_558341 [Mytilinidion resinicola]KAF2812380.1 hypothetical protein BDZ99DRAFT_558341 [Mytilinidion resinicola]
MSSRAMYFPNLILFEIRRMPSSRRERIESAMAAKPGHSLKEPQIALAVAGTRRSYAAAASFTFPGSKTGGPVTPSAVNSQDLNSKAVVKLSGDIAPRVGGTRSSYAAVASSTILKFEKSGPVPRSAVKNPDFDSNATVNYSARIDPSIGGTRRTYAAVASSALPISKKGGPVAHSAVKSQDLDSKAIVKCLSVDAFHQSRRPPNANSHGSSPGQRAECEESSQSTNPANAAVSPRGDSHLFKRGEEPHRNAADEMVCLHNSYENPNISLDRKCEGSKHIDKDDRPNGRKSEASIRRPDAETKEEAEKDSAIPASQTKQKKSKHSNNAAAKTTKFKALTQYGWQVCDKPPTSDARNDQSSGSPNASALEAKKVEPKISATIEASQGPTNVKGDTSKPLSDSAQKLTVALKPADVSTLRQHKVSQRDKTIFNVEHDLVDSVAQESQRSMAREAKAVKLDELRKFSESFKLSMPIPVDLIPIVTKDKGKQKHMFEEALKALQLQIGSTGSKSLADENQGIDIAKETIVSGGLPVLPEPAGAPVTVDQAFQTTAEEKDKRRRNSDKYRERRRVKRAEERKKQSELKRLRKPQELNPRAPIFCPSTSLTNTGDKYGNLKNICFANWPILFV